MLLLSAWQPGTLLLLFLLFVFPLPVLVPQRQVVEMWLKSIIDADTL